MGCKTCGSPLTGRHRVFCSRECQENRGKEPTEARFWRRVEKSDDCWVWTGHLNDDGYGTFSVDASGPRSNWLAHRLAYHLTYGSIPDGEYVLHRCDNPACVRPDHLFTGDQTANMQDCIAKGRFSRAKGERCGRSKLTEAQVLEIRKRAETERGCKIAPDYGLTKEAVYAIVKRKVWKHI